MYPMSSTSIDLKRLFPSWGDPKAGYLVDVRNISHCTILERNAIGFNRQDEVIRTFCVNLGDHFSCHFPDTLENEESYYELTSFLDNSSKYHRMERDKKQGYILSQEDRSHLEKMGQSIDTFWAKYGTHNKPSLY